MTAKKKKKGTFLIKNFLIFSAIILASFMVMGITLMIYITDFMSNQITTDTVENARHLSANTTELLNSRTQSDNPEAAVLIMCQNVEMLSETTDCDVFFCDMDGNVVICPESIDNFSSVLNTNCRKHGNIKIPQHLVESVKLGSVADLSTLGTTYETYHSVAMEPFFLNGKFYGFCVVSAPLTGEFLDGLEQILIVFLISAAIALILVLFAVYYMSEKIARPIRNLETATNLYSTGDFSYKVPEIDSNDELSHLITQFNAMSSALAQMEDSSRSFVANVSHEFKTPMTTIGGFINGILDGTIPTEKQEYYLKIVSSEIDRLSKMVNMMLNISKIETGNTTITLEVFDLTSKLITTLLGFEQLISNKNIEIMGIEDLKNVTVHGDSAMIDQVIYNLVDNAVKFTNEGGKIIVGSAEDKNFAYIAVTNTGKGIPHSDIDKVFERFYKVDQSRSTDTKSTGLGLYLVKRIINLHSGTITVESEENVFTRFTVKLPK